MFEQLDLFANQFDSAEEAVSHINEYEAPSEAAINYIYKNFKELKMTFNMLVMLELRQVGIDYNKLEPEDLIKADYKLIKEAGVDYTLGEQARYTALILAAPALAYDFYKYLDKKKLDKIVDQALAVRARHLNDDMKFDWNLS
ncbi:hypothetical protein [Lactobacillus mulieris]|uniref:hypothetical protein n=1 Tax=Lactobacillus mulieris TaxID=2508708 RepID=UPI00084EB9EC|nr:hypothetical protein [Lactobacillus mulieris]OEH66118.1 hypothetical protein BFX48_01990 [Lactobacillus jensenii]